MVGFSFKIQQTGQILSTLSDSVHQSGSVDKFAKNQTPLLNSKVNKWIA